MSGDGRPVAVVTGSTRGIGFGVAEGLVDRGWAVVVGSRSESAVERTVGALRETGEAVAGRRVDVRRPDECRAFVDEAVERFGRLDLLVNNAGVGSFRPIQEMSPEDWDLQIRTNLDGVFHCSEAAIPHLRRNEEGGWIVNIGSIASRHAIAGGAAYNASKFGLLGLTEAMMLDLRHENVRVSIVMPGSVATDFFGSPADPEESWKLRAEDVARAVVDLLEYPPRALPSRVEVRPTRPPRT